MTLSDSQLIHPTAVISAEAELAPDVQVGPFAIVEGPVRVGPGCVIEGHACLTGPMELGRDNFIGHGAVLGKAPQHRRDPGDGTSLVVGDGNVIREYVTIHRGTSDRGETRIGHRNYLMIGAHVGHDAIVGDGCTIVNGAMIGGLVELQDGCILSAHAAVQQRARIGRLAMIGGLGSTTKDVPPFVLLQGYNAVSGLNLVGLRRAGFSVGAINALRDAYRILYKEGRTRSSALDRIEADLGHVPEVAEFVAFIRQSVLGINPARDADRLHRTF
ncbi:acyl-ACP--UDP-N-acetylglucosamine O-acyltransferase [Tautonia sociabilis]|uniref:Acyl-ACP--UDP-N-acetylglucosamine O-acyltransferase n=1 Tax=Tautonia sociabilis TaxID=2080755 RepID=A0A432MS23_9BACT|nr:acyl-ACP--UDP-N-acetylglucosamine O-acyltransferase [Tautonia sociabilis]